MAACDEAMLESVVFLDHFADLPDPRQLSKVVYPLDEILLLSLLAVLAGTETFTARQRLVLGQVKVADKSNEIVAIPTLLDMLAIEGTIVTIDAMDCQREIAAEIIDKQAEYMLALKGNQGTLHGDFELFNNEQKAWISRTPRSASTKRSIAITVVSRPAAPPSSMTSAAPGAPRLA